MPGNDDGKTPGARSFAALVPIILLNLLYTVIISGYWYAVGADYTRLTTAENTLPHLVVPLGLGAVMLLVGVSWLGWWAPVLREDGKGRHRWTAWVVGLLMAVFICVNFLTTDWGAIGQFHLAMLILAAVLVGFNEEVLFRGINVVGFRRCGFSAVNVWLLTSLLFGLAHLTNGAFGTGLVGGITQAVMTFLAAASYFLLRLTSGSLVLPMIFHGLWDFSLFAQEASGAANALGLLGPLSILISLLSVALMFVVLRPAMTESVAKDAPG